MVWKPDYVSAADVKAWSRIEDTDDDVQIALYVTAASRAVDGYCKRQFGRVAAPELRQYEGVFDRHLGTYVYAIDDLCSAVGLALLDSNAKAVTSYELRPRNAVVEGEPYTELRAAAGGLLSVTSDAWGWSAVPPAVKMGTLLQAARLSQRRDSPMGIAGSPSDGSELRLLAALDPDLRTSLKSYRREVWAA